MEKITRSDPWKGEMSPSSLDTASCFRKFFYDKILGISPDIPKVALVFGTCIHAGIEDYNRAKGEVGHAAAQLIGLKAFGKAWEAAECEGDIKRNFHTGLILLQAYFKQYENDSCVFVPELIECDQWMELPNGCHLLMKIDRVKNENGYYTVVDTKTTSMALTEYYFRSFSNALATTLYFWAVSQVLGQCDAVQIDSLRVPFDEKKACECLARRTFTRTERQVNDAINTACYRSNYIKSALAGQSTVKELLDVFHCNQHNCQDYSGCNYIGLCTHGLSHPSLTIDFKATNVFGRYIMECANKDNFKAIEELVISNPNQKV